MSMEFRIKKHGETHCYYNNKNDLKSLLTALYSAEHPYAALINLDGNKQLDLRDFIHDKQIGYITYDFNFDRNTITRYEKNNPFKISEISQMPLGAAYSLLRFHGEEVPNTVSDYEFSEYLDMVDIYGSDDPRAKEHGYVSISNEDFFKSFLDYLKNTGGYDHLQEAHVGGSYYLAFDQRGFDNLKSNLLMRLQKRQADVNQMEVEINEAFGIEKPFEMTITRQQDGENPVVTALTAEEMRRAYYIVHESFLTEDIQMRLDDLSHDEPRFEGMSGDIGFVNNVLARYLDHSESEISYNDNIYNAIEHEMSKRENDAELSQLIDKLDLNNHSYTFSLVTIDSEDYVTGDYVNCADDLDSLGILNQFDEKFSHDDIVYPEIRYYIIGQSENDSERLPDEFCEEIMAHLNTAIEYADQLEGRNIKVDFNEYGFDEETSEDECEMG